MKAPISKTELNALPDVAWAKFVALLLGDDTEFTPFQKKASLTLNYLYDVKNNGHYKTLRTIDIDKTVKALISVGALEFADMLRLCASDISEENCNSVDSWFNENFTELVDILLRYRNENIDEFYEIIAEDYEVTPKQGYAIIGIIEASLMFILMIIFSITTPEDIFLICLTFSLLAFLGIYLLLYVKTWKIRVNGDSLTVKFLFIKKKTVNFNDISEIVQKPNHFLLKSNDKRLVAVDLSSVNTKYLFAQLALFDKFGNPDTENYSIKQNTVNRLTGILCPVTAIWLVVWTYTRHLNPAGLYEKIFFSLLVPVSFYFMFYYFCWKVTVSGKNLMVKMVFKSNVYQLSDITEVRVDDQYLNIYIKKKRIVKIPHMSKKSGYISQKLRDIGIPFYRNGILI